MTIIESARNRLHEFTQRRDIVNPLSVSNNHLWIFRYHENKPGTEPRNIKSYWQRVAKSLSMKAVTKPDEFNTDFFQAKPIDQYGVLELLSYFAAQNTSQIEGLVARLFGDLLVYYGRDEKDAEKKKDFFSRSLFLDVPGQVFIKAFARFFEEIDGNIPDEERNVWDHYINVTAKLKLDREDLVSFQSLYDSQRSKYGFGSLSVLRESPLTI